MTARFETPEGATPIDDASGLLVAGIYTYSALNAVEAENILQAVNAHLKPGRRKGRSWLTEDYVRKVHRDMFGQVWKWAGRYRETALTIGVPASRIREEVAKLCEDVAYWDGQTEGAMPLVERAARLHHRLVWIHPFPNGNGRHGRMMADIYLHTYDHPLPVWPSGTIGADGDERTEYIRALRVADGGDYGPLTEYTERFLPKREN